jgi:acetolactate synthase small subunit
MKDMLGNKIQKKIDDLHQVVKIKELTPETQIKQEWFPEF